MEELCCVLGLSGRSYSFQMSTNISPNIEHVFFQILNCISQNIEHVFFQILNCISPNINLYLFSNNVVIVISNIILFN